MNTNDVYLSIQREIQSLKQLVITGYFNIPTDDNKVVEKFNINRFRKFQWKIYGMLSAYQELGLITVNEYFDYHKQVRLLKTFIDIDIEYWC